MAAVRTACLRHKVKTTRDVPWSPAKTRSLAAARLTTRLQLKAMIRMGAHPHRRLAPHPSTYRFLVKLSLFFILDFKNKYITTTLHKFFYRYGCCADNDTEATGPKKEGCPETGEFYYNLFFFIFFIGFKKATLWWENCLRYATVVDGLAKSRRDFC